MPTQLTSPDQRIARYLEGSPKQLRIADIPALLSTEGTYRVLIDSRTADELLKRNEHNRRVIEGQVFKWASDMEGGRWRYNGEAVKFSADKVLLDGQHRLIALSLTQGVTIEVLVITGLNEETQRTMDGGRIRSVADQLTLSGIDTSKSQASAMKLYIAWAEGWVCKETKEKRGKLTAPFMVEWAEQHPHVLEKLHAAGKYSRIQARDGLVFASYAALSRDNTVPGAVDEFYQRVLDGVSLEEKSPILALRSRLGRIAMEKIKVSDKDLFAMIIVAFNAWRRGQKLSKIQSPDGGTWTAATFPKVYKK